MTQQTPDGGGRLNIPWIAVVIAACSTGPTAMPMSTAQPLLPPTYHGEVAPILARHCVKCHQSGGVAPFPLTTLDEVVSKAHIMSEEVTARRMPPWGAQDTEECLPPLPWKGDERLSDEQIGVLRRWALDPREGSPTSDSTFATTPSIAVEPLFGLTEPTYDLAPRTAYLPRTEGDDFRCIVYEIPELDAGAFISGIDVIPGDRRIVHHATVFADPDGILASRAGPDGTFECTDAMLFGTVPEGEPVPRGSWMLSWAPGAKPLELKSDIAIELPPHSKIVAQLHYSVGRREIQPDATHLQLRVATERPSYVLTPWAVGNWGGSAPDDEGLSLQPDDRDGVAEFRIPARASDHVEQMQNKWRWEEPLIVYGVRPHAHLAATEIKVDIVRQSAAGNESSSCLVQDRWDFHWQRVYTYDAPIESLPRIMPNDIVRLRCTYDNTLANRRLGQELYERGLQPTDMHLGEATLDEMCLADLLHLRKL